MLSGSKDKVNITPLKPHKKTSNFKRCHVVKERKDRKHSNERKRKRERERETVRQTDRQSEREKDRERERAKVTE